MKQVLLQVVAPLDRSKQKHNGEARLKQHHIMQKATCLPLQPTMAPVLLVRADGQRFCRFAPMSEAALASAEKDTDLRQAKVEEHGHAVGAGGRSPKWGFRASSTFRSAAASHCAAAAASRSLPFATDPLPKIFERRQIACSNIDLQTCKSNF